MFIVKKDLALLRRVEDRFNQEYLTLRRTVPSVEHGGCTSFHWRLATAFESWMPGQRAELVHTFRGLSVVADCGWIAFIAGAVAVLYLGLLAYSYAPYDMDLTRKYGALAAMLSLIVITASGAGLPWIRRQQAAAIAELEQLFEEHMALVRAMLEGDRGRVEWSLSGLAGESRHANESIYDRPGAASSAQTVID
jgi:hypothetical protein